jgi:xanthine dehydrogenase accessory factor
MTTRPDLDHAARTLVAARTPFVLATVVRAAKPTSARPGDRAIIYPDGRIDGFVGGACASASVRLHALRALEVGEPHLLRIAPDGTAIAADDGTTTVTNPCLSGGTLEIFLEPRAPAPVVRVLGDSPIAEALAALAAPLGYHVETGRGAQPDDAAVVIASLGHGDDDAVAAALASGAGYVGLVASRRRGAAVVEALRAAGVSDEALSRLRTPAGLAIGARTHAEIALSILAQIVAARAATPAVQITIREGLADPVCGMVEPPGGGFEHVVYDGLEVAFCCSGCRQRFETDPARYLA